MSNNSFSLAIAQDLYNSDDEFPIDFEVASEWLGYYQKSDALDNFKKCGFSENLDWRSFKDTSLKPKGGRPKKIIKLTCECLKIWGMMSGTAKGKEIRKYFLQCEKIAKAAIAEQQPYNILNAVVKKPNIWDEHFDEEFRYHAERLTGWQWNWKCMSGFINKTVYDYFPKEVRQELDRVNPCTNGYRPNKQHQHLELDQNLRNHIEQVLILMRSTTCITDFFAAMQANFSGSIQQKLL